MLFFNKLVVDSTPDHPRGSGLRHWSSHSEGRDSFRRRGHFVTGHADLSVGKNILRRLSHVKTQPDKGVNIFAMGIGTEEGAPIPNLRSRDGGLA